MRIVVATETGPEVGTERVPKPGPGEALVRMSVVGICGSDLHAIAGHHPFLRPPYRPGHEVVGVINGFGADATSSLRVGDRVVVEPTLPCGECKRCRAGDTNVCEHLQFFGCGYTQGAMADFFTIPAERLHGVPDSLADRSAILIEPLATPLHAIRLAGGVSDKTVVILGAGTIGLLTLASAIHLGARRVIVTDVLEAKRRRAQEYGADAVIDPAEANAFASIRAAVGETADVVLDCVSIQSTVDLAVKLAAPGGTVVTVGVPAAPVLLDLPTIQDKQIKLQGAATYLAADFAQAIELLDAGAIPDGIVTAAYPLKSAIDAFRAAGEADQVKVILEATGRS